MAIKSQELQENFKPVTCFKASSSKQHTFVSALFCQHMTNVKSDVDVRPNSAIFFHTERPFWADAFQD